MEESSQRLIIDASVVIKWLSHEENSDKARRILDEFINGQIELSTTSLCFYEVMNYLGRKHPEIAMSFFSALLSFKIMQIGLGLEIVNRAKEIMKKFKGVSFYDACYHAAAIENQGIFVTADEKYYQQTKKLKHLILLKDF